MKALTMKKLILILALGFIVFQSEAQQDPYFTQFMFNKLSYNPAYAGSKNGIEATLVHHQQWLGFPGKSGPSTQVLGINAPIGQHGLGLNFINDKLGFEKTVGLMASYNYKFDLGAAGRLGVGPGIGFMQKSIDGSQLSPEQAFDAKVPNANVSSIQPDFSFGLYYENEDFHNLYVGASALHISEEDFNYETTPGSSIGYTGARHYYLTAGMAFDLNPNLQLQPNVLVKNDGAYTQFDLNANLLINERFLGGMSYRSSDAASILAGFYIVSNMYFGYSYDMTLTDIRTVSSGTHEIVLNYVFGNTGRKKRVKVPRIIYTPRSLD